MGELSLELIRVLGYRHPLIRTFRGVQKAGDPELIGAGLDLNGFLLF
jgi:hypothetical protein